MLSINTPSAQIAVFATVTQVNASASMATKEKVVPAQVAPTTAQATEPANTSKI